MAFTVDDGFADQAQVTARIFSEFDCPATFFLISGFLDGDIWPWDDQLFYLFENTKRDGVELELASGSTNLRMRNKKEMEYSRRLLREYLKTGPAENIYQSMTDLAIALDVELPNKPPKQYAPMSWDEARALQEQGHLLAPHTVSHKMVSKLGDEQAEYELGRSHARLVEELGRVSSVYAFPNGKSHDFSDRDVAIVQRLGYQGAVSTEPTHALLQQRTNSDTIPVWGRFGLPDTIADTAYTATTTGRRLIRIGDAIERRFGKRRRIATSALARLSRRSGRLNRFRHVSWERVNRLVFLCSGNICRSPYAEAIAKRQGVESISCGSKASSGTVANPLAVQVANERGVNLSVHRSENIDRIMPLSSDLVLGFDLHHVAALDKLAATSECQVSLLGLWGKQAPTVIPDPYGCSADYFVRCFDSIDQTVACIAKKMGHLTEIRSLLRDESGDERE